MTQLHNFTDYLEHQRTHLSRYLPKEFERFSTFLKDSGLFADEALRYISSYVEHGKMLRGTLAILGYEMHGMTPTPTVFRVALAMELLQSFLLIHDDIMDNDDTRRGLTATHAHYRDHATRGGASDPTHYGISIAICYGDVAFALAQWLIHNAVNSHHNLHNPPLRSELLSLFSLEVARVGIGQMEDMYYSQYHFEPKPEEIASLYKNKTGRYTISLPLQVGSYLSGHSANISALLDYGAQVGLIFQLRDDEVGLTPSNSSRKPLGSDITNQTRTYARQLLRTRAHRKQLEVLQQLEQKEHIDFNDIATYKALLRESHVQSSIETLIQQCAVDAEKALSALSGIDQSYRKLLQSLLIFNQQRRS